MFKKLTYGLAQRLMPVVLMACVLPFQVRAQEPVVQHRPYLDTRQLHWGFFFGMNMMDIEVENNGYIDPASGEQWYADVDTYQPGFTVGVLGELRLNKYLGLRAQPNISFGQRRLILHEQVSGRDTIQNMKTTYVSIPISLKIAAPRYNNFRPYVTVGVAPTFDLTAAKSKALRPNVFDCFIEVGGGCDLYLPWFKLIPELKFCFGLRDLFMHERKDLTEPNDLKFTKSVNQAHSSMIVLSVYFE